MITKRLIFAIAIITGAFLPHYYAYADFIYSGCDYVPITNANNLQATFICGSTTDATRTLQGIEFIFHSMDNGGSTPNPTYIRVSPDGITYITGAVAVDPSTWLPNTHITIDLSSLNASIPSGSVGARVSFCGSPTNTATCNGALIQVQGTASPSKGYQYWFWDGDVPGLTNTRIDSLAPTTGSVESTSSPTTISSTGWLNLNDAGPNMQLQLRITSPSLVGRLAACADAICALDPLALGSQTFNYSLAAGSDALPSGDGGFSVSTTTTLGIGNYVLTATIRNTGTSYLWGLINTGGYTLVSTTTRWIVGTSTTSGGVIGNFLDDLGGTLTGNSTPTNSCDPSLNFNLSQCFALLFFPDPTQMQAVFDSAKQGFLSVVPFGYATLLYNALATTTKTQLPTPSYTFSSHYPVPLFAGTTWSFNFNNILAQASEIASSTTSTDDTNPENVWQILMPVFNILIYILLVFLIIQDLTGVHSNAPGSGGGSHNEEERLKEWEYTHRQ